MVLDSNQRGDYSRELLRLVRSTAPPTILYIYLLYLQYYYVLSLNHFVNQFFLSLIIVMTRALKIGGYYKVDLLNAVLVDKDDTSYYFVLTENINAWNEKKLLSPDLIVDYDNTTAKIKTIPKLKSAPKQKSSPKTKSSKRKVSKRRSVKRKSASKRKTSAKRKASTKRKSASKRKTSTKRKSAPKRKTSTKRRSVSKRRTSAKRRSVSKQKTSAKRRSTKRRTSAKRSRR